MCTVRVSISCSSASGPQEIHSVHFIHIWISVNMVVVLVTEVAQVESTV